MTDKYRDYIVLNRNLIISIISAMFVSALFAQGIKEQTSAVNATLTIVVSYVVYYVIFGILYYKSNKGRYVTKEGTINKKKLRKDLFKIITSVGIAEVIFFSSRWVLHYYFLGLGQEPFLVSITAHAIASAIFLLSVNIGVYLTKLYKRDS